MTISQEEVESLVTQYAVQDLDEALSLVTGLFVGLYEAKIRSSDDYEDGDEKKNIKINGSYRDITINKVTKQSGG